MLVESVHNIPALHKARWVFITIKIEGDFYDNFYNTLQPFISESLEKEFIENYIFAKEVNQTLLLFLKTTPYQNTLFIKPQLKSLYGEAIISHMDFYLFNFEIAQNTIEEELLTTSSRLLTNFILENKEEWSEDLIFPYSLNMHIIFSYAMGMRRYEMKEFYNYTFHNSLRFAFNDKQEQSNQLIEELRLNFEFQKSELIDYVDYIYTQLEENDLEEHVHWYAVCQKVGKQIEILYQLKQFKQDIDYKYDDSLLSGKALQERWKLFEQYIYFIDGQLTNVYNLQFILKESIAANL